MEVKEASRFWMCCFDLPLLLLTRVSMQRAPSMAWPVVVQANAPSNCFGYRFLL